MSFLDRKSKESNVSRYVQSNVPTEEGSEQRTQTNSSTSTPDSLVKQNSAGGKIQEKSLNDFTKKGKYGKVRVLCETKSGHVILVDETENNERILILHPNGSYIHFDTENLVTKVEGNDITLVSKEQKIEVKQNKTEIIHGNVSVTVDKDETRNISGNLNITINGNCKINSSGNTEITSSSLVKVTAPKIQLN